MALLWKLVKRMISPTSRARFFQKYLPGRMGNDGEQMLGMLCSHGVQASVGVRMRLGRGSCRPSTPGLRTAGHSPPPSILGPGCSPVTMPTRKGGDLLREPLRVQGRQVMGQRGDWYCPSCSLGRRHLRPLALLPLTADQGT